MKVFVFGFEKEDLTKFPAEFEPISVTAKNWPPDDIVLVSSLGLIGRSLEDLKSVLERNQIHKWRKLVLYIPKICPFLLGWADEAFQKKIFEGEWKKLSDLLNKKCPICGNTNKGDADFCVCCGWNLNKKVTQNFCIECGNPIAVNGLIHPYCQICVQTERTEQNRFLHCIFCGEKLAPYSQKAELRRHCSFCGARIDDTLNLV